MQLFISNEMSVIITVLVYSVYPLFYDIEKHRQLCFWLTGWNMINYRW